MTKKWKIACLIVLVYLVFPFARAFCSADILNVRRWTAPDHTRVVIDVTEAVRYKVTEEGASLSIELNNSSLPPNLPHEYFVNKPAVKKIILSSLPDNRVIVRLELGEHAKPKIFRLGPIKNKKPHRVVIDVMLPEVEKKESEERKQVKIQEKRKIVVIDPGHGGEDPGAVGRKGTKEKDVVLKIAKNLKNSLRRKGYLAYLTREGDYYVPFKKRLKIAREYGADVFISIHADAHRSRGARGASVYCLSTRGASSEAARLLAKSENLSDVIAGVSNGENGGEADPITLNMLQTETINQSKYFGVGILKDLKKVNHLKYSKVHEAPFRVLRLAEIPSILVEVAYISNPREERLLRSSSYQKEVAWSLASSVNDYCPLPPSLARQDIHERPSPVSVSSAGKPKSRIYVVKRGDSLDKIARSHGTTVETLMRANDLRRKNRIYVNQKLVIPSGRFTRTEYSTYVVKRGDILERIADKCDTTAGILMRVNHLRSPNRIYVGQRLKVPFLIEETETVPVQQPKPSTYVVKKGDGLDQIARRHDTDVENLMKLNNLRSKNRIYAGQNLRLLPDKTERLDAGVKADVSVDREQNVDQTTPPAGKQESVRDDGGESAGDGPDAPDTELYRVRRGDTLGRVAYRYGTTIATLLKLNDMRLRDRLYAGQGLKVPVREPERGIYVVKRGDRLDRIARKHNTTVRDLKELNNLRNKNRIYVGQKLKVLPDVKEHAANIPTTSVTTNESNGTVIEADNGALLIAARTIDRENQEQVVDGESEEVSAQSQDEEEPVTEKTPYDTYVVKRGDRLDRIASRSDTSTETLLALNDIQSKDKIYVNQRLKIPTDSEDEVGDDPDAPETELYRVRRGDTLGRIAYRYGTTIATLLKLNDMRLRDRLYAGQRLKVPVREPERGIYVVKRGDRLDRIARRHNVTVRDLMDLNDLRNRNRIYVGQKLKVLPDVKKTVTADVTVGAAGTSEEPVKSGDSLTTMIEVGTETSQTGTHAPDREKQGTAVNDEIEEVTAGMEDEKGRATEETLYASYIVKQGDNLDWIARRSDTSTETLLELNNLQSKDKIYVNQRLQVPSVTGEAAGDDPDAPDTELYRVRRGDTLARIAHRHGTTIATLLKLNDMKLHDRLYTGQKLKVPSEKEYSIYVVRRGDFLAKIAGKHNTTTLALRKLNNLRNKNHIFVGQRLRVPYSHVE